MTAPPAPVTPNAMTPDLPVAPTPVEPPAMKPRMSAGARGLLFLAPFALLGLTVMGGVWATGLLATGPAAPYGDGENRYLALYATSPPTTAHAGTDPDGAALYAHHCARCHGVNGDGNGPTPLSPKARHFGYERFKFTDTLNGLKQPQGEAKTLGGIPTDDVLVALVRRGIAGSPMPSFAHLSEDQLRAVVGYVKTRFVRPDTLLAARLDTELRKAIAKAKDEEEDFDPKKDWPPSDPKKRAKWVQNRDAWFAESVADVTASEPMAVPSPFPEPKPGYEQRAAALFEKLGCLGCHGKDGKGTFDAKRRNDNGTQAYPRDLTAAVYKGGPEPEHLYRRIYLGIPGTPMKAFGKEATADEIADLVYFVKRFAGPPQAPAQ